jgi:hypothetical protein
MLPLPTRPTDELELADWCELNALLAEDRSFSFGDLERALNRAAVFRNQEELEEKMSEVSFEIEARALAASEGYAFTFDGYSVEVRADEGNYYAYVFCLCLSYFGWEQAPGATVFPARMFEWLSSLAARRFVQGEVIRFAAPREGEVPGAFRDAVDHICRRFGEGIGLQQTGEPVGQDDTLDIVAWRDFPDGFPGKLLLFGQCAAGGNWEEKISDLQPRDFCDAWMQQAPSSTLLKALFIPHRLESEKWRLRTIKAKLIFDRCRIAYLAHQSGQAPNSEAYMEWSRTTLEEAEHAD